MVYDPALSEIFPIRRHERQQPGRHLAVERSITVTTPTGTSTTSAADQFTYNAVPVVTGVSPNTGNLTGLTPVTITGPGFTGAGSVMFGVPPFSAGMQPARKSPAGGLMSSQERSQHGECSVFTRKVVLGT
jgi:hypothetical protein